MSSPYTVPTGPGYQGIKTVTSGRCLVNISPPIAGDWPVGAPVSLQDHELGVAAIRGDVSSPLPMIVVRNAATATTSGSPLRSSTRSPTRAPATSGPTTSRSTTIARACSWSMPMTT